MWNLFEQKLEYNEGVSHRDIWRKSSPGRGDSEWRSPEVGRVQRRTRDQGV